MKFKKKTAFIEIIICFMCAVAHVLVFSFSTSPLYFFSENDSAVYVLLGKFMKDGLTMYRDFFEHKGPIIFFIEWIGSIISEGRLGAFFIQIGFMTFTIWGTYRIAKIFVNNKKSIAITVLSMLALNSFYEGGNLTEEFCLPAIILSIWIAVRFFKQKSIEEYNYKYGIIYGITFTYCAFMRLTNALPICIFVFVIIIYLIKCRHWKDIFKSVIAFIIGMLIVTIPIIVYCAVNGIVQDMLYGTFLYNFIYVVKGSNTRETLKITKYLYLLPLLAMSIVGIVGLFKRKHREISIALIISGLVSLILQLSTRFYLHYSIIWIPVFTVTCAVTLIDKIDKKTLIKIPQVILLVGVLWIISKNTVMVAKDINTVLNNRELKNLQKDSIEISKSIKNKNRVIAYNTGLLFYLFSDIDPCYRLYTNQDWLGLSDKNLKKDFSDFLKSKKAEYVVTQHEVKEKSIIESNYKLIKKTERMKLYQLIE